MTSFMSLAEKRVSVRSFLPDQLPREKTDAILTAMRLAPSAVNRQAWKFLMVEDRALIDGLAEATGFPWLRTAPAVLAAVGLDCGVMTNGHRSDTVDLSIAMTFGMLEATAQGLGTCWLAHYEEPAVRRVLSLPEEWSIVALMPIGYPAAEPTHRPRKPLDEVAEYR